MVTLKLEFNDQITQVVVGYDDVTIGRSKSCTHTIADSNMSSIHCRLYIKDSSLIIEDLDSKNGILLNSIKISKEKVYLSDVINIGSSILKIDRLNLDIDSIEILSSPSVDDRDFNLELEKPIQNPENQSVLRSTKIFNIQPKQIKDNKFKIEILKTFKVIVLLIVFLIIYKLLR